MLMLTIFLRHDQSQNLDEIQARLKQTAFYQSFPPQGVSFSWYGKIFTFLTTKFGPAQLTSLTLVEIDEGSVNSYAAPGLIFLSPAGIGEKPNLRLLANEIGHQWWRHQVSPASKQNLWLDVGMATYCEMLYTVSATAQNGFAAAMILPDRAVDGPPRGA